MKKMDIDRYRKIKRLADQTPFQGEKNAANQALKKVKDPRLSSIQIDTIAQLSNCGFKITYDVTEPEGTCQTRKTLINSGQTV